jgi:hypothetical protein
MKALSMPAGSIVRFRDHAVMSVKDYQDAEHIREPDYYDEAFWLPESAPEVSDEPTEMEVEPAEAAEESDTTEVTEQEESAPQKKTGWLGRFFKT